MNEARTFCVGVPDNIQPGSNLSTTTVMLGSTEFYFSSAGKAVADHHRAIVQFVQVRERGRITQRI
ncbi:hypothetical protein EAS62_37010 [Bradyrhizobium zhanjiangense]|uniref:Uncharacterized protein n=1 Tax=Bradyrhizobium zhanjiangense TaxID=1325107 RepID=A0ABY0D9L6_9BRAD|nr:hypothetical protein EAS62_37010 [Bradyrhizobium zhanjiangense]